MKLPLLSLASAFSLGALATSALGDVVVVSDGSQLFGEILGVNDGVLRLETRFAGTLEIELDAVTHFSSEEPQTVRLSDGNVFVGPVTSSESGEIAVATSGGRVSVPTSEVAAVWEPGDRDPEVVAREAELEGQMRRWSYEAAVSLTGKSGNTNRSSIAVSTSATLEGPSDRFNIYGTYQYATEERVIDGEDVDARSADEAVLGLSYTSFFSERWGWYVREEIEYDTFENIDFRSTTAAGMSYRVFDREDHRLEARAGIAYRYESYYDIDFNNDGVIDASEAEASSDDYPALDFGLNHYWRFADWGEMSNKLTFTPSIDDFGNYLVDHQSAVDIPLGASDFWKLRLGLNNQYNSEPSPGREELDTTYLLSLLLNWR